MWKNDAVQVLLVAPNEPALIRTNRYEERRRGGAPWHFVFNECNHIARENDMEGQMKIYTAAESGADSRFRLVNAPIAFAASFVARTILGTMG